MRQEKCSEMVEFVRLRNRQAEFRQKRLDVLFGTLLAMEADAVMNRHFASVGVFCEDVVLLGLFEPLPRAYALKLTKVADPAEDFFQKGRVQCSEQAFAGEAPFVRVLL